MSKGLEAPDPRRWWALALLYGEGTLALPILADATRDDSADCAT
jgi:hypothetical protein